MKRTITWTDVIATVVADLLAAACASAVLGDVGHRLPLATCWCGVIAARYIIRGARSAL